MVVWPPTVTRYFILINSCYRNPTTWKQGTLSASMVWCTRRLSVFSQQLMARESWLYWRSAEVARSLPTLVFCLFVFYLLWPIWSDMFSTIKELWCVDIKSRVAETFPLLHRSEQTCFLLWEDHHQQELPCHPQQCEAHYQQEQVQEGPAHGELTFTLFHSILDFKMGDKFVASSWSMCVFACVSLLSVFVSPGCPASCQRYSEEPEACCGQEEAHKGCQDRINTWLINKMFMFGEKVPTLCFSS